MNEILIKTCNNITADFSVVGLFQLVGMEAAQKRNKSWELETLEATINYLNEEFSFPQSMADEKK